MTYLCWLLLLIIRKCLKMHVLLTRMFQNDVCKIDERDCQIDASKLGGGLCRRTAVALNFLGFCVL